MDWIYIFFTGCAVLGFCDSVFDENPNYNLIVIKGFIVIIAGYIVAQGTENKRVDVAETLVHAQYNPTEDIDPTAEYENENYPVVGDDDFDSQ